MFDGLMVDAWSVRPDMIFGQSELSWSIAADPAGRYAPNILSELDYRNMGSNGLGITIARLYPVNTDMALYADGHVSHSKISSGISQDSDYAANNRQQEFSRSYADIENDDHTHYGFTLGLKMRWLDPTKDFLSFFMGREQQDLNITTSNGVIAIANRFPVGLRFDQLNSTYNSRFASWSLGVGAEHAFSWGIMGLRYDYYDTSFDAKANWNLRTDFEHPVSFTHNGQGDGHHWQISYSYPLNKTLSVNAQWQQVNYRIHQGYDQTFYIDNDNQNSAGFSYVTQLNEVDYRNRYWQLGIAKLF